MTDATELDEAANGMTPVDPALIEVDEWLNVCGSCDAGLPVACSCPTTDPRPVITRLLAALDEARAEVGELRLSRAELADECESLRSWVADGKAREMERIADAVARVTPCSCSTQRARAEAAESALAAVEQERDRAAAALTLQRHETSLVREARGEAMAEVEHWRALAERAWDEAVASAYLHETENWTGIKHADNPYRAALATPTTPENGDPA